MEDNVPQIANLAECSLGAIVEVFVPKNVAWARKHPGRAVFLFYAGDYALPVHLVLEDHFSHRYYAEQTIVGSVTGELITERGGQLRKVMELTPVRDRVANACLELLDSGEFAVVAL